ncbi:MAG: hypothetical protein HKN79_03100, partial [Flavobacteriales bacterium]|nr:hypothetical protein [Flavobacteriales bacterium]
QGMDMPTGQEGPAAEQLAQRILDACNVDAWDQTRYVQWTFAGSNSYLWDRTLGKVEVVSGHQRVILNTADRSGVAFDAGQQLEGEDAEEALTSAWARFCNDSFWLIAPFKVKDPGTHREYVETEEGPGLLVKYSSGGVTPGDSYLWYVAEDGFPYAYRMWTSILPVPGMRASWEEWTTLHTGAKVATVHALGPAQVNITDLASASSLEELGLPAERLEP